MVEQMEGQKTDSRREQKTMSDVFSHRLVAVVLEHVDAFVFNFPEKSILNMLSFPIKLLLLTRATPYWKQVLPDETIDLIRQMAADNQTCTSISMVSRKNSWRSTTKQSHTRACSNASRSLRLINRVQGCVKCAHHPEPRHLSVPH